MAGGLDPAILDGQRSTGESRDGDERAHARQQASLPVEQEVRIPAAPDDDVTGQGMVDFSVQSLYQDTWRDQRRRVDTNKRDESGGGCEGEIAVVARE